MIKKIIIVLVLLLSLSLFACTKVKNDKKSIVVTIAPIYEWVSEVLGDEEANFQVTTLINNKVDMHSYQASVADVTVSSMCDLFIYIGGESDSWVDDILKNATNKEMIRLNLMEALGDRVHEEEEKEGMQEEEEEGEEGEEEVEYDEHIWLSLKNAMILVEEIKNAVVKLDETNSAKYDTNAKSYISQINELDLEYEEIFKNKARDIILVADRFPFLYLCKDYGIDYRAAFKGCSADSRVTPQTQAALIKFVDEFNLKYIYKLEDTDGSLAKAIKDNSRDKDQIVLVLNSLQSITVRDIKNGDNYLKIMRENLENIWTSLQ